MMCVMTGSAYGSVLKAYTCHSAPQVPDSKPANCKRRKRKKQDLKNSTLTLRRGEGAF